MDAETRQRMAAEWSDAVAAVNSWPGPPGYVVISRLIAAGDALLAAIAEPEELEQFDPVRDGWVGKDGQP